MNANDVLKMIDAGFTADEIRKMTATADSVSHVESSSPEIKKEAGDKAASAPAAPVEEKKEAPAAEEKKEDPMDSIRKAISDEIAATMKSYEDNMAKIMKMAGMPSLDDVKPKGIEDIISNFFKEE